MRWTPRGPSGSRLRPSAQCPDAMDEASDGALQRHLSRPRAGACELWSGIRRRAGDRTLRSVGRGRGERACRADPSRSRAGEALTDPGVHLCRADDEASGTKTAESRDHTDIQAPPNWIALIEACTPGGACEPVRRVVRKTRHRGRGRSVAMRTSDPGSNQLGGNRLKNKTWLSAAPIKNGRWFRLDEVERPGGRECRRRRNGRSGHRAAGLTKTTTASPASTFRSGPHRNVCPSVPSAQLLSVRFGDAAKPAGQQLWALSGRWLKLAGK